MVRRLGASTVVTAAMAAATAMAVSVSVASAAGDAATRRPVDADAARAVAATLAVSDACWLATVDDPATTQQPIAVPGADPFIRMRWRLRGLQAVAGRHPPAEPLLLDEFDWRGDLTQWQRCRGDLACIDRPKRSHPSARTRPPRPGEQVLVFARSTPDGWQLAAVRGFDVPERARVARGSKR